MKTKEGSREYKMYFEKSKMSFGIMAPVGSGKVLPNEKGVEGESKIMTDYDFVNFSNIKVRRTPWISYNISGANFCKGSIIEEKIFQVKDKSSKTIILEKVVNLDRLPRARFTLKEDEYGKK